MLGVGLSVSDVFSTRKDVEEAMRMCAMENKLNYNTEETPKSVSMLCKGREGFGCEAKIVASLRKKDGAFVVKKIKLAHKCPPTTLQYNSPEDMMRAEIHRVIGGSSVRVGEVVLLIANLNIKAGYLSVWKAMRERDYEQKENVEDVFDGRKKRLVGHDDGDVFEEALSEFNDEFLSLNSDAVAHHRGHTFFFSFPSYLDVLIPIVEVRVYKRADGVVVFGVLHDPVSAPVVYSCAVGEKESRNAILRYFIESMPNVFLLVDFNIELISLLQGLKRDFFVKTRDICRFYYNKVESTRVVEKVWNKCNNDESYDTPELEFLPPERYVKTHCKTEMFGLQNTGDCEVDFINPNVFGLSFFDCVNMILKLISDNLKHRKRYMSANNGRLLFGHNVAHRIERNLLSETKGFPNDVDLENRICTCGKFQEFLIPCPHACKMIVENGDDPYLYVSCIYSKERLLELKDVVPVVNLLIRCLPDKHLLRRGPGRPKKTSVRETCVISY